MSSEEEKKSPSSDNVSNVADNEQLKSLNETAAETNNAEPQNIPVKDPAAEKKLRAEAKNTIAEAKKLFKRGKKKLSEENQKEVLNAISALEKSLENKEFSCCSALESLKKVLNARLKFAKKSGKQEVFESLLIALLIALFIRTFFIEPFKIPTRSMVPTLLEGDQLFVSKLSYGIRLPFLNKYVAHFSDPERGDVVVFAFPREDAAKHLAMTNSGCLAAESLAEQKDYIKRIIGLPGDKIEVIDQVVYVNGEPIFQQPFYERMVQGLMYMSDKRYESWNRERHGSHEYMTITHAMPNSNFGPITVAPDHVFVMGDNRDNSADSRCWGQVPVENIKGRAQFIWWSGGAKGPRTERMFTGID